MPPRKYPDVPCAICGTLFHPRDYTSKYCSRACANKSITLPLFHCAQCGVEFAPLASKSKFCSRKCYELSERTHPTKTCVVCGVEFRARFDGTNLYCSKRCKGIGTRKHQERNCAVCGKAFRPTNLNAHSAGLYCSQRCMGLAMVKYPPRPCKQCGKVFKPKARAGIATVYCSLACKGLAARGDGPRSGKNFTNKQKTAILQRDGHICVRCGSSERLQVDHILAIRNGGDGSLENGQTICFACHILKTRHDQGWS